MTVIYLIFFYGLNLTKLYKQTWNKKVKMQFVDNEKVNRIDLNHTLVVEYLKCASSNCHSVEYPFLFKVIECSMY